METIVLRLWCVVWLEADEGFCWEQLMSAIFQCGGKEIDEFSKNSAVLNLSWNQQHKLMMQVVLQTDIMSHSVH